MTEDETDQPAASEIKVPEAELVDRRAHELLLEAYANGSVGLFSDPDPERLSIDKKAGNRLVAVRLAFYPDEARDHLSPTNSGRYWALNGGYMAFLKEDPPTGGGGTRGRNPEMEALRFTYMKLRLNTFWLSFGLSIAGFVISLVSIAIAFYFGDRFPR